MTEDEFWDSLASVDRDLDLNAFQHWQKLKEVVASTNPNLDEWGASLGHYTVFIMWRLFSVNVAELDGDHSVLIEDIEQATADEMAVSLDALNEFLHETMQGNSEGIDEESIYELATTFNARMDS